MQERGNSSNKRGGECQLFVAVDDSEQFVSEGIHHDGYVGSKGLGLHFSL